jgi:hypothetical protein|tara:strand:+ start:10084 stop:10185 length:102 start_codon:yes stop_codon:yes gene_type:complete
MRVADVLVELNDLGLLKARVEHGAEENLNEDLK